MKPLPLPIPLCRAVDDLFQEPLEPPDVLRRQVAAHLARIRDVAAHEPMVDLARAEAVARACHALLDAWAGLPLDHQRWVQAACRYFVRADDEEDDLASIIGFDDDTEVLDHALDQIGRADLKEP
jgi:hypothetical protein